MRPNNKRKTCRPSNISTGFRRTICNDLFYFYIDVKERHFLIDVADELQTNTARATDVRIAKSLSLPRVLDIY